MEHTPLKQLELIDTVRRLALEDERVAAVLMYGSFIKDEADCFSDVEFYIFYGHEFDFAAFIRSVAAVEFIFTNEFGTEVALFKNLIRGEFHFKALQDIEIILSWQGLTSFEHADRMNLVDKDGRLAEVLGQVDRTRPRHDAPQDIDWLAKSLLNNLLLSKNLLLRGEYAHAQMVFQYVQKYLLYLLRLKNQADRHWESPTKRLEAEIPALDYQAYAACVPDLNPERLARCLAASLALTRELFAGLAVDDRLSGLLEAIQDHQP